MCQIRLDARRVHLVPPRYRHLGPVSSSFLNGEEFDGGENFIVWELEGKDMVCVYVQQRRQTNSEVTNSEVDDDNNNNNKGERNGEGKG